MSTFIVKCLNCQAERAVEAPCQHCGSKEVRPTIVDANGCGVFIVGIIIGVCVTLFARLLGL